MAKTRKDFQREADLPLIERWYLQGHSQQWIASNLAEMRDYQVSQQTISNDLALIKWRWQDNTRLALDTHKAKELARIDLLEREYWQ